MALKSYWSVLPLGPHFSNMILFEAIDPAQALSPKAEGKNI